MDYLQLSVLVCSLIKFSAAGTELPGKLLSGPLLRSFPAKRAATKPTCDGVSVYSTCNDCSNVLVCLGSTQLERSCNTSSQPAAFCVNGTCSAIPDTAQGCFPPPVICTDVGFFPDPTICQIYHYCEGTDQESSVYECPPYYMYDAETALCNPEDSTEDCVTVVCDQDKIFVSYGTSKKYFAFCLFEENAVSSIQVFKCPDNYQFHEVSCVFECPEAGNYAHMDATKYFQCYHSGAQLVFTIQSCPSGTTFVQSQQVCVTSKVND
uniref:Putative chitin binding peritrophin-a domain protein n=1 Tax=Aedes albopictus TaxID=7160 RepID=A0A023ELR4_AEDAL